MTTPGRPFMAEMMTLAQAEDWSVDPALLELPISDMAFMVVSGGRPRWLALRANEVLGPERLAASP